MGETTLVGGPENMYKKKMDPVLESVFGYGWADPLFGVQARFGQWKKVTLNQWYISTSVNIRPSTMSRGPRRIIGSFAVETGVSRVSQGALLFKRCDVCNILLGIGLNSVASI